MTIPNLNSRPLKRSFQVDQSTKQEQVTSTSSPPSSKPRITTTMTSIKTFPLFGGPTSRASPTSSPSTLRWHPSFHAQVPCLYASYLPSKTTVFPRSAKVAAYDVDGCLIKTHGSKFPTGATDWQYWHPNVPDQLREMHRQGYVPGNTLLLFRARPASTDVVPPSSCSFSILLFSNQNYKGKRLDWFKTKMTTIVASKLKDIPMRIFAATEKDHHRKGVGIGMWQRFLKEAEMKHDEIDWQSSFFVGDAAGRAAGPGRPKDHSDVDLVFANSVGLRFMTPEQHFLGQAAGA
ncbi:BZ3500_MvSof-1268-A1-R1_Chr5-2g07845 [Microbotryum saponariae]|uniref:BZ3500_MvSof-1268-A1-R1_Chr5-2g07845 protein n=1 Tax=Microbotryum saponariae TaxID=289078 RepID=A0A2X0LFD6_9BASI|nr:BZ3500_MvSof-1268-A1-R1_Chr5-2g07845 [Microbotryum saponariae]SDA05714.1 BZ3501_MvSof-1269-A2-R1_Chr5-2g07667 [Microbotryum saponariae]